MKKHNSEVQQHKQFVRAFEKAKKKSIGEELFQAYAEGMKFIIKNQNHESI